MYLTKDITGAASKVEKGKAGDKVTVLGNHIEMVLVENQGERFFVFPEDLTENYFESYEKSNPVTQAPEESSGGRKQARKRKR